MVVGGLVSAFFIGLGVSILKADKNFYEANRRLTGKASNPAKGTVQSFHECSASGRRDHHVHAGLSIRKDGRVIPQGGLSDEAIANIIK